MDIDVDNPGSTPYGHCMTDTEIDRLHSAASRLAVAEATVRTRRDDRDLAILDALEARHSVSLVSRVSGVSRTYVRRIASEHAANVAEIVTLNEEELSTTDTARRQRIAERRTELQRRCALLGRVVPLSETAGADE